MAYDIYIIYYYRTNIVCKKYKNKYFLYNILKTEKKNLTLAVKSSVFKKKNDSKYVIYIVWNHVNIINVIILLEPYTFHF